MRTLIKYYHYTGGYATTREKIDLWTAGSQRLSRTSNGVQPEISSNSGKPDGMKTSKCPIQDNKETCVGEEQISL